MTAEKLDQFRDIILSEYPDLAASTFRLATVGWDSIAVDVDDRLIFKFPRNAVAQKALVKEASLLSVIRPGVSRRCQVANPCRDRDDETPRLIGSTPS